MAQSRRSRSPPPRVLFFLRFLHPLALLIASVFTFSLPSVPYFLALLLHHRRPSYSVSLSRFPAIPLLFEAVYAVLALVTHLVLALLAAFSVFDPTALAPDTALSLAIPRYAVSPWQGIRFLVPHLVVLAAILAVLFTRIPPHHRHAGERFLLAWLRRRKRHRARAQQRRRRAVQPPARIPHTPRPSPQPRSPSLSRHRNESLLGQSFRWRAATDEDAPRASDATTGTSATERRVGTDFGSLLTDDDVAIGDTEQKYAAAEPGEVTRFTAFMAGKGGIFWVTASTALVAVSYSSFFTFLFLVVFLAVVVIWAFHLPVLRPKENPCECLAALRVYRWYIVVYLMVLVVFQIPWLVKWHEAEHGLVTDVLSFVGIVPINTAKRNGWTAVTAFGAALAAYLFSGMFGVALETVCQDKERSNGGEERPESASGSPGATTTDEGHQGSVVEDTPYKLTFYELQVLFMIKHASSLGLLVWALVFPGILTLPFLFASIAYLASSHARKSKLYDYVTLYAMFLQLGHYVLNAVVDSFRVLAEEWTDGESAVIRLLGLRDLHPQFSANVIQTVAVALLCMTVASRRYLNASQATSSRHRSTEGDADSRQIGEFVQRSLYSSRKQKHDSLYSPVKLCIDQLALASLYVAGGLDLTALNAVFLVALSTICILQSFGLFRRPKIFLFAWSVVLAYSIFFLFATSTFCRALSGFWTCSLTTAGIEQAEKSQVVAYAVTVVMASVQISFTWAYKALGDDNYVDEFQGTFWRFLRNHFLYVAYGALLLYPLVFPANFLSYGYVLFLFLSIAVELIIPSLKKGQADVRRLLKKYWTTVILFACAAMLARFFIRLDLFSLADKRQRWLFGVDSASRKLSVTIGDALVLIVVSLQGRLFVVDCLVKEHGSNEKDDAETTGVDGNTPTNANIRDTVSEPGDFGSAAESKKPLKPSVPRHRRYRSVEEYLNSEFSADAASVLQSSRLAAGSASRRLETSTVLTTSREGSRVDSGSDYTPESLGRQQRDEIEMRNSELQQFLNKERITQALDMFRNFRKSVPFKQTEKFIQESYSVVALLLRNLLLQYSYVLQAFAILAASVWLPGVSIFGALYILLGCVTLLTEPPSFSELSSSAEKSRAQWLARALPSVLVILSFSLMSAQYIYIIALFFRSFGQTSIEKYLGLQERRNIEDLPITAEAIIAHVLVFVTAIVQRVSLRWKRMDAERVSEELRDAMDFGGAEAGPMESAKALDKAVPIGSVLNGVGGLPYGEMESSPQNRSTDEIRPSSWAEMRRWNSGHLELPVVAGSAKSDSSDPSFNSDGARSKKNEQKDMIERLRGLLLEACGAAFARGKLLLCLLHPFWRYWGFDVTFTYLVICGAATRTVFSVLYVSIVMVAASLRRSSVKRRWHQISAALALTVFVQYALTLGLPRHVELNDSRDEWKQWLLLDPENSDSSERKFAVTFAFLAVTFAGITLNDISTHARGWRYWLRALPEKRCDNMESDASNSSLHDDTESGTGKDITEGKGLDVIAESALVRTQLDSCPGPSHSENEPDGGSVVQRKKIGEPVVLSRFVSGLGRGPAANDEGTSGDRVAGGDIIEQFDEDRFRNRSRRSGAPIDIEEDKTGDDSIRIVRSFVSNSRGLGRGLPAVSSEDPGKQVFRATSSADFTRRPMSFQDRVKLSWMRFSGPLVQLYALAVATVYTNIISGLLLLMAFSFLFQFTNVAAKKTRFTFVRWYVVLVILAMVIFQAPFSDSSSSYWTGVVGLYKKETSTGETLLYLMVSLWILCQIQGRIYESDDFEYVERYGDEDAKVRFKRAVHEHNSRKYAKMQDRNKAERSQLARDSRLERLKVLKGQERSVDAFYKVCVKQEIAYLQKQAKLSEEPKLFASHRLVENAKKEEFAPKGFERFLRRLLRGRRWQHHLSQPLYSEFKSFIFRYSAWPVYGSMLLAALLNPSLTTVVYPLFIFLYLIVEQPRPPKQAWSAIMVYVCIVIGFKYVWRSPYILGEQKIACDGNVPFFALDTGEGMSRPSVTNFQECAPAAGIGYDMFVLLFLLVHRAVLYSRGVWDLVMSEEDMLLRSEIRGREIDTAPEMSVIASSDSESGDYSKKQDGDSSYKSNAIDHVWNPEQQCDDVGHVLSQARREILGNAVEKAVYSDGRHGLPNSTSKSSHTAGKGPSTQSHAIVPSRQGLRVDNSGLRQRRTTIGIEQRSDRAENLTAESFWDGRRSPLRPPSGKLVPTSAPRPRPEHTPSDPRSSPSTQDSDPARARLNRFFSLRGGNAEHRNSPPPTEPMTSAQSRVQQSLIQGKVIRSRTETRGGNLTLFEVERKGILHAVRQHFLRLNKENDHKAVGDYYLLIFVVDFISFVYVMFGFSVIFGDPASGREETWWTTNFIETRHLLTLLAMFMMLIFDRVCYLKKSMRGKLILQYSSVIVYHVVLFVLQDHIGTRVTTQLFYLLRCVYFLLSGLQIRNGFPRYTTAQYLLRNYTTLGIVMFEIYIFVPFLWLSRTLLDWTVLPTSLELFQYFRFIDIYLWLYRNRAVNTSRGAFRRQLGQKRRMLPRIYQGVGLFLLCVIALFIPFIIFSVFNPFFVSRDPQQANISVRLVVSSRDEPRSAGSSSYLLYSRTAVVGRALDSSESVEAAEALRVELDVREREKVFETWFSPVSDTLWQPVPFDRNMLIDSLSSFIQNGNISKPFLLFTMTATTRERDTLGNKRELFPLNKAQSERLLGALIDGVDFATKLDSPPLPRYSIISSGQTVFEPVRMASVSGDAVCLRLVQQGSAAGTSFWTMSDCRRESECTCETDQGLVETSTPIQILLQVADISSLQVGGATILTLYTAILFTIANLLKRMFFDKRLIIPYIDMPYTLHLYQVVLDIMYARQDEDLVMEEILYNGLIDIYRDQHELVRWTGERALKLPLEWWDKNVVDDPFMVYPSFTESATEPYLTRKVE